MKRKQPNGWKFIDQNGTFQLDNPHHTSGLYFPLVNKQGMMSVTTPNLHGDIKTDLNTFLMQPVSIEDLHNTRSPRNFWVYVEGSGVAWSVTGGAANQVVERFQTPARESVTLDAGLFWQKLTREHHELGLRAETTNFVPAKGGRVEMMRVDIENVGEQVRTLVPTAAIPLFGRSADNLRDHRQVTSLLHRIHCASRGIEVKPTLSFDERGHTHNRVTYAVYGVGPENQPPTGYFPYVAQFVGEGGALDWPQAVVENLSPSYVPGDGVEGEEALGGLRFDSFVLEPGESVTFIIGLVIALDNADAEPIAAPYLSPVEFDEAMEVTQTYWRTHLDTVRISTGDSRFDGWMRWVSVQPILRRWMGNSFMPYHDYGRGGRGWRDLWQDVLGIILLEDGDVRSLLQRYFAGVRLDGSNATIIGRLPGEFKADRNNIPRTWMDHAAWPLLTTQLYMNHTGDEAFLLLEAPYFKDKFSHRTRQQDYDWVPEEDTWHRKAYKETYQGTILEHILVQHLVAFFNVGEHNTIKLEDADWNDGMDMAAERGESVAFTAMYAGNLRELVDMLGIVKENGHETIEIFEELVPLLSTLSGDVVPYDDPSAKQAHLAAYFDLVAGPVSGRKVTIAIDDLRRDLESKADWMMAYLREEEWLEGDAGAGWFNGYYDNVGARVERTAKEKERMTLAGQVFQIMSGTATPAQIQAIITAADRYLFDEKVGGYRLNTDFGENVDHLGRAFGFAFGHKENGAMFSHMAVMYGYALYHRGYVNEGFKVLDTLYSHCQDFDASRMYPGIPEYVSPDGRGRYPYLTGSASWYLLTVVTKVFGVRGYRGDLCLSPKLTIAQFQDAKFVSIHTLFAGRKLVVQYHNPLRLDFGQYRVVRVTRDGVEVPVEFMSDGVKIPRDWLTQLDENKQYVLVVELGARTETNEI